MIPNSLLLCVVKSSHNGKRWFLLKKFFLRNIILDIFMVENGFQLKRFCLKNNLNLRMNFFEPKKEIDT